MTTKDAFPYVGLVKDENGNFIMGGEDNKEVYLKDGMFVEAFIEMSRILNFTYSCREPPDNQYGAIRADGTHEFLSFSMKNFTAKIHPNLPS